MLPRMRFPSDAGSLSDHRTHGEKIWSCGVARWHCRPTTMTQIAHDLFGRALSEQHARNEARRIRTRVHEARRNPHAASIRWPFELLQNALDSGPRNGCDSITVRLRRDASHLTF